MAGYSALPFVAPVHPQNLRLADLYLRTGENQAEAANRQAVIQAQLWSNLGQTLGHTVETLGQIPAQEQARKERATAAANQAKIQGLQIQQVQGNLDDENAVKDAFQTLPQGPGINTPPTDARMHVLDQLKGNPQAYQTAMKHFDNIEQSTNKLYGDVAAGVREFGDSPEAAMGGLAALRHAGFDPVQLDRVQKMIESDPSRITPFVNSLLSQSPDPRHQAMAQPKKPADLIPVAANTTLFDTTTKKPVYTAPGAPKAPGSLNEQLLEAIKSGDTVAEANIRKAIEAGQRPSEVDLAARAAKGDKDAMATLAVLRAQHQTSGNSADAVEMSPLTIEEAAHRVRLYGPQSIPTRFNDNDKKRILNKEAEINQAMGTSPLMGALKQASQKADQKSLDNVTRLSDSINQSENKATAQAELVRGLSKQVGRSDYPILNGMIVDGKAALGDTPAHLLGNALITFTNEHAKIMEGSTASAAGSSDSARKSSAALISKALSDGTLQATLDQMQREMHFASNSARVTKDDIMARMGGQPSTPSPVAPTAATQIGPFTVKVKQ